MSQITRCPFCATTFKVVADQLRISDGWVRCGQCKEVFDASEHLLHGEVDTLLPGLSSGEERGGAQSATTTQAGANVWSSGRDAVTPVAGEEPLHVSDGLDEPVRDMARIAEDKGSRASVSAPVGNNQAPTPLSLLLRREALPESVPDCETPAQELPGYELPGASDDEPTWPQGVSDDAEEKPEAAAQEALDAAARQEQTTVLPETDDESAEQTSVVQSLESLSSEPIPIEEAVVLPTEALLDAAPVDAAAVPVTEPGFVTAARRSAFWRRPWVRGVLAFAGLCLMLLLGLQFALQERDAIAARSPAAQALMERVCQALQCTLEAPRRIDAVIIDSSSFVKARDDMVGYQLQVGIKNISTLAVAMPALELTLLDAHEQTLLRRVLRRDELGAPAQLLAGASWSAAIPVQVMQDASRVAGYRLLAFYP